MEIVLNKKPKNPTIIEGFPGFGLIGTITTEFLINHLEVEEIGQIFVKDAQPIVAIHEGRLVKPITLYYNKEYNMIIVHAITNTAKSEWDIGTAIHQVAKDLDAKMIISIEGVMSKDQKSEGLYYHAGNDKMAKVLEQCKIKPLKEGIVVGVTAALLAKKEPNFGAIFAETHSQLPDSRAAAGVITCLDKILGLKVDAKPLLKQAELFEAKLKNIMDQSQQAQDMQETKRVNYVG